MVVRRFGWRQSNIQQNFGQEVPGADAFCQQIGVFAYPAQAGLLRQRFFEDWPGIDVPSCPTTGKFGLDLFLQFSQPGGDHVVIILVKRVKGNIAFIFVLKETHVFILREIICAQADDAFCSGQNFLRVKALFFTALDVCHLAVIVISQPMAQTVPGCPGFRDGDAKTVETQAEGLLFDQPDFFI